MAEHAVRDLVRQREGEVILLGMARDHAEGDVDLVVQREFGAVGG